MNSVLSSVPMCLVVPISPNIPKVLDRKIRSSTSSLLHSEFKAHLVYVSIAACMERYPSQGTPRSHGKQQFTALLQGEGFPMQV